MNTENTALQEKQKFKIISLLQYFPVVFIKIAVIKLTISINVLKIDYFNLLEYFGGIVEAVVFIFFCRFLLYVIFP